MADPNPYDLSEMARYDESDSDRLRRRVEWLEDRITALERQLTTLIETVTDSAMGGRRA